MEGYRAQREASILGSSFGEKIPPFFHNHTEQSSPGDSRLTNRDNPKYLKRSARTIGFPRLWINQELRDRWSSVHLAAPSTTCPRKHTAAPHDWFPSVFITVHRSHSRRPRHYASFCLRVPPNYSIRSESSHTRQEGEQSIQTANSSSSNNPASSLSSALSIKSPVKRMEEEEEGGWCTGCCAGRKLLNSASLLSPRS